MKDFCRHLIATTPHIICSNVTTSSTIFSFSIPDFYSRVYVTGSNDHPRFVHVSFDCVSLLSFYGQQQLLTFFLNPLAEVLKFLRFSSHFVKLEPLRFEWQRLFPPQQELTIADGNGTEITSRMVRRRMRCFHRSQYMRYMTYLSFSLPFAGVIPYSYYTSEFV